MNADIFVGKVGSLFSHNIYTYSINNPIVRADKNGRFSVRAWLDNARTKLEECWEWIKVWYNTPQIYGSKLYYQGNAYELTYPGKQGVTISSLPKTLATGKGYIQRIVWDYVFVELGRFELETKFLHNTIKDGMVAFDVTIKISQIGDQSPVASVYFTVARFGTDTSEYPLNVINESVPISVLGGDSRGYWLLPLDGQKQYVRNDYNMLSDAIASVEMEVS